MLWTMWHLHPTIVLSLPSIWKVGSKHHSVDYHCYSHIDPPRSQLLHPLTVVQRQLSIVYHYSFNHNAAKAKPLYEVKDPPPATQNSKVCRHNYNNYSQKKERPSHTSRNSRTSRQATRGCCNVLLPMCRIQPTPPQRIRNSCQVELAVNWITLPRS